MPFSNLFFSKRIKIIFTVILAVVIATAFSADTYFFIHNENRELKEPPAFTDMVAQLKQQAHDAIYTPHYPERGEAINGVGEKLKEILTSEYTGLVTNDTFNSDEFSVILSVYPLQNGRTIKRIIFTMKNNENDIPYEESRLFLQHIGDADFFSDIEQAYPEKAFQVFETKDGVFAFLLSCSDYDYTTYSSNRTLKYNYTANVYILRDNNFSAKEVEIPLSIDTDSYIKLVQQSETIKSIVYYNSDDERPEGAPECTFNSAELSFEFPKGNVVSDPIDFDFPGLLLGLSDTNGNLRTLYIRKENGKIRCDEYAEQIIFPRLNKLYSLKSYTLNELMEEFTDDGYKYRTGNLGIKKILCAPLGIDLAADFEKIFYPKPKYNYYVFKDIPLYIGSEYVCYIQYRYYSGGGTFSGSVTDIRFDKLDNLSKFTSEYKNSYDILTPDYKEITLADLIYGAKAKDFYQSDVRTYGGALSPYVDFRQLSIKRNLGKWSLMLPVMDDYYHPGNGSHYNRISKFAAFSNDVPAFLASDIVELQGDWNDWSAKDIFKFTGSDVVLYQFDYHMGVENRNENSGAGGFVDMQIPVKIDEYIVSMNFADKNTQKAWSDELKKIGR